MLFPPQLTTRRGEPRRVGVEIEFAGIEAGEATTCVTAIFGGRAQVENRFSVRIEGTPFGEFTVEVDQHFLSNDSYREALQRIGIDIDALDLRKPLEELLASVAELVVPLEICAPPVPMLELPLFEKLIVALRERGARGTGYSPLYAFGMQFNPEVVSLEPDYILRVLQAFLLLEEDIRTRSDIDLTRRVVPFVRPFERRFVDFFLDPGYAPVMPALIDDYLRLNPTRNRPLDLLPLLAWIDEDRVAARASQPHLVKPRPTFHYRLPDCRIDRGDWTLAREWAGWVEIERLADDRAALAEAIAARSP